MSQTYEDAKRVPITVVQAGPCVVTQIKKADKDGYWAVQIGFGNRKPKNTSKALQGHFKASNSLPHFIKEIRVTEEPELKVGDKISLEQIFTLGDSVNVTGISKGKGFAGAIKRWGFHGGSKTHGQSDRHRAPGSIGQGTTPGRVYKGKHMAGRMGSDQVTLENLKIAGIDQEKGLLSISGSIPGRIGGYVVIKRMSENKVVENQSTEGEQNEQN